MGTETILCPHAPRRHILLATVATAFGLVLTGCGSSDDASVEQQLLKQQRRREARLADKPVSLEEGLEQAREAFSRQNYQESEKLTLDLLRDHPTNGDVILLLAQATQALGDLEKAIERLDQIPESDVEYRDDALRLSAKWFAEAGDYEQAIARLELLRDTEQTKNRDLHELAALLNNSGRRIEASAVLYELLRLGDVSEKELFSLITLGSPFIDETRPKPNFTGKPTLTALAEARIRRQKDANRSLAFTKTLRELYPESPQVFAFLARLLAETQDWDRLREQIELRPKGFETQPEFWYALGLAMQQQQDHRQAVGCFRKAISLDPTDRFSFAQMATSLAVLGESDLSEEMMRCHALLDESSRLIRKIGKERGTQEQLERLATILDEMQRPLEAVEWRLIAAKQLGGFQQDLDRLEQAREQALAATSPRGIEFILSGIDPKSWPAPSLDSLALNTYSDTPPEQTEPTTIRLSDVAADVGLDFQYTSRHPAVDEPYLIYHLNGGGIGVLDYDLDGWPDCYFSQSGGPPMDANGSLPNQLFRNLAGQSFLNTTNASGTGDKGFGQGIAAVDLNQDGFVDLLVANLGTSLWYRNQGDGTFLRQTLPLSKATTESQTQLPSGQWTTSIAAGDLSGDALPEVVLVNYSDDPDAFRLPCTSDGEYCSPIRFRAAADQVLTLQPNGQLAEWESALSADINPGHGFGVTIGNFDQQPGNELFIVNDTDANHYWQPTSHRQVASSKSGATPLRENAQLFGLATGLRGNRQGCMGLALGDFDRNGWIDFHVTNYWDQPSDLYLQQPGGLFQNATMGHGVGTPSINRVGWGTQATDLDRDGWLDLVVLNGHVVDRQQANTPFEMQPQLFQGGPQRFRGVTPESSDYWSRATLGRCLATLDWNGDGKTDLVANHLDVPVALLENDSENGNWIRIELTGRQSERGATGATVTVESKDGSWTRWVVGGDGFQCSNESVVDVGLGRRQGPVTVRIEWPSGTTQRIDELELNRRYLVIEGQPEAFSRTE